MLSVSDARLENFGTWRDHEGRLVWGINGFDEAADVPYAYDLVRLAASARLARDAKDKKGKLKPFLLLNNDETAEARSLGMVPRANQPASFRRAVKWAVSLIGPMAKSHRRLAADARKINLTHITDIDPPKATGWRQYRTPWSSALCARLLKQDIEVQDLQGRHSHDEAARAQRSDREVVSSPDASSGDNLLCIAADHGIRIHD